MYRRLQFCCWTHAALARKGTENPHQPDRKRIRNGQTLADLPPDPPAVFRAGLAPDTHACPKCQGLLLREPALLHCRTCGTLWPILGADYRPQMLYELAAATVHNHGGALIRKGAPGSVGSVE